MAALWQRLESELTAASHKPEVVSLVSVRKAYGDVVAVEQVDLVVRRGEFFTLLGPSGSGKTTLLRLIAGFEWPDAGHINLNGVDVSTFPPYERDVNTVFQDYALFPHMTVAENISYGLLAKGASRRACVDRVAEALGMVRLTGLERRRPGQLSGGQRQRVALARAIVNRPQLLLLDEPLGALDLKLRQEMQIELKRIQREVQISFLYVTHDQEEALTMSDRVAILNKGRVEQVGTPMDIYERPATEFVAGFVGVSNVLERGGRRILLRPEKIHLVAAGQGLDGPGVHVESGSIREAVYAGVFTRYIVDLDGGDRVVVVRQNVEGSPSRLDHQQGQRVQVMWRFESAFDLQDGGQKGGQREEEHR